MDFFNTIYKKLTLKKTNFMAKKPDEDNYNDAVEAHRELFGQKTSLVKKNNILKDKLKFMGDGKDKYLLTEQIRQNDLESERLSREEIEPAAKKLRDLQHLVEEE
jgi:hypothetical protein